MSNLGTKTHRAHGSGITAEFHFTGEHTPASPLHRHRAWGLDVEAELDDVAIGHDVILTFDPNFPACLGFSH